MNDAVLRFILAQNYSVNNALYMFYITYGDVFACMGAMFFVIFMCLTGEFNA